MILKLSVQDVINVVSLTQDYSAFLHKITLWYNSRKILIITLCQLVHSRFHHLPYVPTTLRESFTEYACINSIILYDMKGEKYNTLQCEKKFASFAPR